jgi:hypothetical protein
MQTPATPSPLAGFAGAFGRALTRFAHRDQVRMINTRCLLTVHFSVTLPQYNVDHRAAWATLQSMCAVAPLPISMIVSGASPSVPKRTHPLDRDSSVALPFHPEKFGFPSQCVFESIQIG